MLKLLTGIVVRSVAKNKIKKNNTEKNEKIDTTVKPIKDRRNNIPNSFSKRFRRFASAWNKWCHLRTCPEKKVDELFSNRINQFQVNEFHEQKRDAIKNVFQIGPQTIIISFFSHSKNVYFWKCPSWYKMLGRVSYQEDAWQKKGGKKMG